MKPARGPEQVPGFRIDRTIEAALRFRKSWSRYHKPDDVNQLLRIFPRVGLQRGYVLDYRSLRSGAESWIWPYAHHSQPGELSGEPAELTRISPDQLLSAVRGKSLRQLEAATLYRFLEYERTAAGVVEYGFFVNELWALKSEAREQEWLSLKPLLVRHKFDSLVRRHRQQLVRIKRPPDFDPEVQLGEGGSSFSFLAYQPGPWRRIARIDVQVAADGAVAWGPSKVLATLAT